MIPLRRLHKGLDANNAKHMCLAKPFGDFALYATLTVSGDAPEAFTLK